MLLFNGCSEQFSRSKYFQQFQSLKYSDRLIALKLPLFLFLLFLCESILTKQLFLGGWWWCI